MRASSLLALLWGALLFGAGPARAQVAVVGELVHEYGGAPGSSFSGVIQVRNETTEFQEVKVYQTDYLFYADGTNLYGEPGSNPRSNAGWITFAPEMLVVPPGQTLPVTFTVNVPADAATPLSGTYWSLIMVEGIAGGSAESALEQEDGKQQLALRATMRYGIQVITHLEAAADRSISFSNTQLLEVEAGEKLLQVDLVNDGDLSVRPEVWVELYDAQGSAVGRIEGRRQRIYPGTSVRERFNLGALQEGAFKALVFVDAGGDDIFGAQYTLEF